MRRRALCFSIVLLGKVATATAQPTPDGQLVGTVRDPTGAVVIGAAVALASPSLIGGPLATTTGQAGVWRAAGLPAGAYDIHVSAPGFRGTRREGIRLVAGATLTVDFVLEIEGVVEIQRVEAPAPIVDVTNAAVPTSIGERFLLDLPASKSITDVAELINLVPGVAGDMAFGGSKRSNAVYVDGVDTTESSEQNPWLKFTQNWLSEVQVVGLGAEAEHGKFTGVAAYAVVRSGANTLSGLGEYWTTSGDWVATNTEELSDSLQRTFQSEQIDAYWNVNGQAGGPIRRDRVWFFAGVDHTTNDRAPAGYHGPGLREEDDTRAIGKITAAAWPGTRLEGFIQGGRRHIANAGIGPLVDLEAAGQTRQPQFSWSARGLGSLGSSLLLDLRYTGYDSPRIFEAQPPQSNDDPPGHYDLLTGRSSVNVASPTEDDRTRHALAAVATWYPTRVLGTTHELKFGVEFDRARERTTMSYPGDQFYLDYGGEPNLVLLWEGATLTGDTSHVGLFVQDRIPLGGSVTLLPGIRFDAFRGSTPGAGTVFDTNPMSPRVGLAWDVRGDHRTVVRAHYGRYTDPAFAQAYLLTDQSDPSAQVTARVVGPGEFEEINRSSPSSDRSIDPSIRHSKVDQVVLGAEQQILGHMSVQAHYIYRRFDDFMSYVTSGAVWAPVQRTDPGPDGLPGTSDDGMAFTVYNLTNASQTTRVYTNPPDAWRRYHAVQLIAHKRLADRWQLQASYTWSRSKGTMANGFHANSGIRSTGVGDPNSLINGAESLPHDPSNEVKLVGSWNPEWLGGFTVGGVYRYMTGSAWGRTFVVRGLGQGAATILAEPRGTRRVDAINNLDMRVEKLVPLGAGRSLGVLADVFNVTNQGAPDSDWAAPVVTTSGPSLGLPTIWRQPRQLRVAVRVSF